MSIKLNDYIGKKFNLSTIAVRPIPLGRGGSQERHEQYENYGGRGIKVCERWSISFDDFVADMGLKPDGMSIERIDVNGDYEPGNCKWATNEEQSRNRRSNINITMNGKTQCVKDWCDELELNQDKVYGRIRWGRSPVEALKCVINQS